MSDFLNTRKAAAAEYLDSLLKTPVRKAYGGKGLVSQPPPTVPATVPIDLISDDDEDVVVKVTPIKQRLERTVEATAWDPPADADQRLIDEVDSIVGCYEVKQHMKRVYNDEDTPAIGEGRGPMEHLFVEMLNPSPLKESFEQRKKKAHDEMYERHKQEGFELAAKQRKERKEFEAEWKAAGDFTGNK